MSAVPRDSFNLAPAYQPLARRIGLDAAAIFEHPQIRVWRTLPERENATLDAALDDGRTLRLHVKRYAPTRAPTTPADAEVAGIRLLQTAGIATVPLAGWGRLADGRSFILTEDLAGFLPADQWVRDVESFARLRDPIADLAAQLHSAGLHHRDLYPCHIFVKADVAALSLRLIDAGRVRPLPRWPLRHRWIVKDLAQLWYGTLALPIDATQRRLLIQRYASRCGLGDGARLLARIARKSDRIARHDARLRQRQPGRNISIEPQRPA